MYDDGVGVQEGTGEDETWLGRDGTGCCTTGSERRERKETELYEKEEETEGGRNRTG